jgi:hypothetical protein
VSTNQAESSDLEEIAAILKLWKKEFSLDDDVLESLKEALLHLGE